MFWSLLSLLAVSHANPVLEVKFTYEVRLQGKQICSGTQIIETERAVELCARDYNHGTVKFRAKVNPLKNSQFLVTGYLTEHDKDGMPASLSSPQIMTLENERSQISTSDENDQEVMALAAMVAAVH